METQNPTPVTEVVNNTTPVQQTNTILPNEEPKKKKYNFLLIGIIGFLFLAIPGLITYYLLDTKNDLENNTAKVSQNIEKKEEISVKELETVTKVKKEKIFYTAYTAEEGTTNIFSYDLAKGNVEKLTNETSATMGNEKITNLQTIDDNYIGFEKSGDIYALNLETRQEEKIYETKDNTHLLGFNTKSTFAFLAGEELGSRNFILVENDSARILKNITEIGGERGANFYDSWKIEFSENSQYVFLNVVEDTNTSSIYKNSANLHIYDLQNNTDSVIKDATHATWLDNENIIYVGLDFVEDEGSAYTPADAPKTYLALAEGLYKYNIVNQTKTKISVGASENLGRPAYISNKLAYVVEYNEIWTYDFDSNDNTKKFTENFPNDLGGNITALSWIDEQNLVYKISVGSAGPGSYTAVKTLNLTTGEDKEIARDGIFDIAL